MLREDVIVLFYGGTWCPWSRDFWPVWAAVAARFHALCFVALDAYTHPTLNANYGVYGFPTVLRFRGETPLERYAGDRSEDNFLAWVVNVTKTAPAQPEDVPSGFADDPLARALPEDKRTDWLLAAAFGVTAVAAVGAMMSSLRTTLFAPWDGDWTEEAPHDVHMRPDDGAAAANGARANEDGHAANGAEDVVRANDEDPHAHDHAE
jgi:hypothetical protein